MRVTLINPPAVINLGALGTTMSPTPPIGLAYVAAVARQRGHDVRVVDAVTMSSAGAALGGGLCRVGASAQEVVTAVPLDSEVVGVACMFSHTWPLVRDVLGGLRARLPQAHLLVGGEHASALPELVLAQSAADSVVVGEGEQTLCELLDRLALGAGGLEGIGGVVYRHTEGIRHNPRRRRMTDLRALPRPAWDLLPLEKYFQRGLDAGVQLGRTLPIVATRGCPYSCTFCVSPGMWGRRYVARDVTDVVDEMQQAHERHGVVSFLFQDLTSVLSRRWMMDLTGELIRRALPVQWQFPTGTRCDVLDEELAARMVAAGCRFISFAPETGSDERRAQLGKQMTSASLYRAVEASVGAGLSVTCFFIVGMPGDRAAHNRATLEMVRRLARRGVSDVACHYFYPAAGSRIYRDLLDAGRLTQGDDELLAPLLGDGLLLRPELCFHERFGPWQQLGLRLRVYATFYGERYLRQPDALARLVVNVLRGRQTNKLEAFARALRRRAIFRRGGASRGQPSDAGGTVRR